MGQISRSASLGEKGCAGSEALHSLPRRLVSSDIIDHPSIPCSHLPLTAKRDSGSGEGM